jgi:hypothetical protein
LQINLNDQWIVGMYNSDHSIIAYRPSDGLQRSLSQAASGVQTDEPHLDREYSVVYITGDVDPDQKIWNLVDNTFTIPNDPEGINEDSHSAVFRGKAVAISWQGNAAVETTWQGAVRRAVSPSPTDWSGDYHLAGQWIFNNPNEWFIVDQWASDGTGNYPIRLGMIGFASAQTGDVRLLAKHDGVGDNPRYGTGGQPHPTLSPDGKLVMWTSNMNGLARYDVFVARVPTS